MSLTNDAETIQRIAQIKELQEQLGGFNLVALQSICEIQKNNVRHDLTRALITRNPATQYTLQHVANEPASFLAAIKVMLVEEYLEDRVDAFIASASSVHSHG